MHDLYKAIAVSLAGSVGGLTGYFIKLKPDDKILVRPIVITVFIGTVCGAITYLFCDIYSLSTSWAALIAIVSGIMGREFIKKITEKVSKKIDDIST